MDSLSLLQRLQRPDLEDLDETDHIIEWVAAFTGDEKFLGPVQEFVHENAHEFGAAGEKVEEAEEAEEAASKGETIEYSLRHMELYEQFSKLTESRIEEFLASKGCDAVTFYKLCREEMARSERMQRNTPRSFFVQLLLGCSEFSAFAKMMSKAGTAATESRSCLATTARTILAFLDDDDSKTSEFDEDDVAMVRKECNATVAWVTENPSSSLAEIARREAEMEEVVNPLLEKYGA